MTLSLQLFGPSDNPADLLIRGLSTSKLKSSHLWTHVLTGYSPLAYMVANKCTPSPGRRGC